MSNEDSPRRSWGNDLIKKLFSFDLFKKTTTHKLGQNPISLNSDILNDPEVLEAIEHGKGISYKREACKEDVVFNPFSKKKTG